MAKCETLKVIQASGVLLKQHQGPMTRLRLLKLLYIADRECLAETLRPVTYDKAVAMDHGPVLSKTYDLLNGSDIDSAEWDKFIRHVGPHDMQLIADPGVGELSRYEIDKLIEVSRRFWNQNDWDVAEATHAYAEWQRNQPPRGGQKPIPFDDRIAALGLGEAEKLRILQDHREDIELEKLLASVPQLSTTQQ